MFSQGILLGSGEADQVPMASLTNIAANVIIERATVTRVTAFPCYSRQRG